MAFNLDDLLNKYNDSSGAEAQQPQSQSFDFDNVLSRYSSDNGTSYQEQSNQSTEQSADTVETERVEEPKQT